MKNKTLPPELYPPISPFEHGFLEVDEIHKLYWEQSGNPQGIPVVFLHGGPGSGTSPIQRRYFNPENYRVVLFDQRGCGKSIPYASTKNNTTWDLVLDMEKLRKHLKIEKWLIFGGSWGSTLGLCYGIQYPNRCLAFILRGIFLARRDELDWFLKGIGHIFPEAYDNFQNFLPETEQKNLLVNYHRRLMNQDVDVHLPAANAWNTYEAQCSVLIPKNAEPFVSSSVALARLEAHYFINEMFLRDKPILDNLHILTNIPAIIVQGRYDIICPTRTAFQLTEEWQNSKLKIIPNAGHSAAEPSIQSALIESMSDIMNLI